MSTVDQLCRLTEKMSVLEANLLILKKETELLKGLKKEVEMLKEFEKEVEMLKEQLKKDI
ncbi:MAG: hypothetical protein Q8O68_00630 [Candidatus Daviesbacteria bacterium]|nr:hypothetical protein [Candidatus Daviesbacteria bacterium]